MKRLGYYGDQKPSPQALRGLGLTSADAGALQDFMWLSNSKCRTIKALVDLVATGGMIVPDGLAGGGRTVSVVSREDAAKQTGTAFFELLGRHTLRGILEPYTGSKVRIIIRCHGVLA